MNVLQLVTSLYQLLIPKKLKMLVIKHNELTLYSCRSKLRGSFFSKLNFNIDAILNNEGSLPCRRKIHHR